MPVSNSYNLVSEWLPASLLPLYPGCYEIERIDGERQVRRYELAPGGEPGQGAAWGEDVRRWRGMQAPKLATRQRLSKNVYAERQANDKRTTSAAPSAMRFGWRVVMLRVQPTLVVRGRGARPRPAPPCCGTKLHLPWACA